MKDPALAVLQGQLPSEIQPLAIALLSSEQAGMKQFEHAIQKIASEVQTLDRAATAREISHLETSIDSMHGRLAMIDRKVSDWATKNLAKFWIDSDDVNPLDAAREIVEGAGQYEWLPDALGIADQFAPQITDSDIAALRTARRELGSDIEYLGSSLPQLVNFPEAADLLRLHRDLSQYEELRVQIQDGSVPALAGSSDEAMDQVRLLANKLSRLETLTGSISSGNYSWVGEVKKHIAEDRVELFDLLNTLGAELKEALSNRTQFVRRPVTAPGGAETDPILAEAVGNLCDGKRPFGISGVFGKGQQKTTLEAIRVLDAAPKSADDWKHVEKYFALLRGFKKLCLRWNALAREVGLPAVNDTGPEDAMASLRLFEVYLELREQIAVAREASDLCAILFPTWRPEAGKADNWDQLKGVAHHHIRRQDLANVWITKDRLQKVLDGKKGPIIDRITDFITHRLGSPKVSDSDMQAEWSALTQELSRVLALRGLLQTVREVTDKIAASGASSWASQLTVAPEGVADPILPDNWRNAWRLRRISTHLEAIDPKEHLKRLGTERRQTEEYLASAYRDAVVKRTWLKLAENASPSIRAALQSYLAAIQRIGKGTGKRAVRFRQDARDAASQANPAVPCWIMPHYRISESLPPELGCFDLVVIDEASQSDLTALPALLRAKKVLVVGDDRQVSPEGVGLEEEKVRNLMSRFLGEQVETYRPQMDPSRSVYDLFKVVFATNSVMLKEHFRCVGPIIEYSKREFYAHELRPLRLPKASERLDPPLIDVLVEDGYRRGDVNQPEMQFVIDEIKKIVSDPSLSSRSIGVVSLLGDKQTMAIWDRLAKEIALEDIERHEIACGDARTFQGKERDIMFLTMVSAPNDVGAPLVRAAFEQRFNVAASRARDRMYLVRSVTPENLSEADKLRRSLISHFAAPFAQDENRVADLRKLCESPFELEVYDLLVDRGYRVQPQVKVGQYRIDMVVEGDNDARLAVECDGDKYHGADKWADDMRRQGDLERAGWHFWRCFASTFLRRREDMVADLISALSERGIEPIGIEDGPKSVHTEHRTYSSTNSPDEEELSIASA
jgi:very-short-patch-repair endonuclease